MNLTADELVRLENAKSEQEWNRTCNDIKKVRGGQYPPDWFAIVLAGGLMTKARNKNGW